MLKRIALMIPQLRRVREHIHRLDALYRQALQEAAAAARERDEARARVQELEQTLAMLQAEGAPAAGAGAEAAAAMDALRLELAQLERAYRASIRLNTELMAQLPFRGAA
ncbi:MAG: hypothetical protein AB7Q23_00155 [Hyphomonadaceae bacterium]